MSPRESARARRARLALEERQLRRDARNRALRTTIQNLGIDVGVAVATFVLANLESVDLSNKAALITIGGSLIKTVLSTIASYVMRRWVDRSRIPTPLPPDPPGEPDDDAGRVAVDGLLLVAIVLLVAGILLALR